MSKKPRTATNENPAPTAAAATAPPIDPAPIDPSPTDPTPDAPSVDDAGGPPQAPPLEIRWVTIRVPVVDAFPIDVWGKANDGGQGYIETRLGRGPAQGIHRVLLATQTMARESRQTLPEGVVPAWKSDVSTADAARYIFGLIERAVAGEG